MCLDVTLRNLYRIRCSASRRAIQSPTDFSLSQRVRQQEIARSVCKHWRLTVKFRSTFLWKAGRKTYILLSPHMAKPAVEGCDYPDDEVLPMCNCWLDRVTGGHLAFGYAINYTIIVGV